MSNDSAVPRETLWPKKSFGTPWWVITTLVLLPSSKNSTVTRTGGRAELRVVADSLQFDDFFIGTANSKLAALSVDRDLHFLDERSANSKIHNDLTQGCLLATGPLLIFLRRCPPSEHARPGSIEDPRDLDPIIVCANLRLHLFPLSCCACSFLSNSSSASKLKFRPASHWAIHS